MSRKGRVLVAMSGGIDSTVSAILLHEEGYEVIGVTLKTWDYASFGKSTKETGCCSLDSINDARDIAVKMGFHHFILDITSEFGDKIISNFVGEYVAGRTPNPCVLCNTYIKWEALLKKADALNCEFIATGHYAQRRFEKGRHIIFKGRDEGKDQSYVLWGLTQENLKRTLFPIGGFQKTETRKMAEKKGFPRMSLKKESYDICFIPDGDYHGFINRKAGKTFEKGNILNLEGAVVGEHKGYPFYTVGQRKGIGVATGVPQYVLKINPKDNTITIGDKKYLENSKMKVEKLNLIKYPKVDKLEVTTKIRYKHEGTPSTLKKTENGLEVNFHNAVKGIALGQSAVFYEGDDVVGGGIIYGSY